VAGDDRAVVVLVQSFCEFAGDSDALPEIDQSVQPAGLKELWNERVKVDHRVALAGLLVDAALDIVSIAEDGYGLVDENFSFCHSMKISGCSLLNFWVARNIYKRMENAVFMLTLGDLLRQYARVFIDGSALSHSTSDTEFADYLGACHSYHDVRLPVLLREARFAESIEETVVSSAAYTTVPEIADEYLTYVAHLGRFLTHVRKGSSSRRPGTHDECMNRLVTATRSTYAVLNGRALRDVPRGLAQFLMLRRLHAPTSPLLTRRRKSVATETGPADAALVAGALSSALEKASQIAIVTKDFDVANIVSHLTVVPPQSFARSGLPVPLGEITVYFPVQYGYGEKQEIHPICDNKGNIFLTSQNGAAQASPVQG